MENTGTMFVVILLVIVGVLTVFTVGLSSGDTVGTKNTYQRYCDSLEDYEYIYGKVGNIKVCLSEERYQVIKF